MSFNKNHLTKQQIFTLFSSDSDSDDEDPLADPFVTANDVATPALNGGHSDQWYKDKLSVINKGIPGAAHSGVPLIADDSGSELDEDLDALVAAPVVAPVVVAPVVVSVAVAPVAVPVAPVAAPPRRSARPRKRRKRFIEEY